MSERENTPSFEPAASAAGSGPNEPRPEELAAGREQGAAPEDNRTHRESLGDQWAIVLGGDPAALMGQVVGTVLNAGGTRECWRRTTYKEEYVLMAWPAEGLLRASVLMRGPLEGELKPSTAAPLLEGLPNNLMVEDVHVWPSGVEANVGVSLSENSNPMWFYDPLYYRDKEDLTPGVTHTFLLAGLSFGIRQALLDEMTINSGPQFEAYAEHWLAENPGKSRLDVPPIKIPLTGSRIIMPGEYFGEYHIRVPVTSVEKAQLERQPFYAIRVEFGMGGENPPLQIMIYAAERMCKGYEPKAGDEIDAIIWLQGRVIDV